MVFNWFKNLLTAAPTWSTLRTLGHSRIISLTIFVPFIGTLIFFNDQIVQLLILSPTVVTSWNEISDPLIFTLNRLQLVYLGLSFLGIGTFLYTIYCPPDIKQYQSVSDFIEREKPLITSARCNILVRDIVEDYLEIHGEEEATGLRLLREVTYPTVLKRYFLNVIEEIYTHEFKDQNSSDNDDGDREYDIFSGASANFDSEKVARIIYYSRHIDIPFWSEFELKSRFFVVDLLTLKFSATQHSRPVNRLAISVSYGIGFFILFVPTLVTFFAIVRQMVWA